MPPQIDAHNAQSRIDSLNSALQDGAWLQVRRILNNNLKPADIAHLLESSTPKARDLLWELLDSESEGEVLLHLGEEIRGLFMNDMSAQELASAINELEPDDLADLLQELPDALNQEVLKSMDQQDRDRVATVLSFDEDSAGGLMNTDTITIRPDISLEVVFRYLRRHKKLPDMTDNLLVVNRRDEFIGALPLSKMLVSDPNITVREVMDTEVEPIPATMEDTEVAQLFERHDWVSAPVIDDNGKLLGRITIDDVVDVIREEADHTVMSMAGLDEDEDTFAPVWRSSRSRAVWLGINLITAFVAAAVMGQFEASIQQIVALAVLSPVVASMGGIAGSQTLTLVIRGAALGQVNQSNFRWLLGRELGVGVINGVLWASVIAAITMLWYQDLELATVIAAAVLINLTVAVGTGASLPMILRSMDIDPALSGSVILTTVTDVVGFLSFLGLATWLIL